MAVITQLPAQNRVVFLQKSTSNKSFLDMHYFLKERGIKNNDFFLVLRDSGLAGVDPRDPNLTPSLKLRILQECRLNYFYFIREVARVPIQGGQVNSGIRYKLNRANLAMNFLFSLNCNMYVELPRQFGKTTAALFRYLWVYNFGTSNSEIMFMHKDHSGSKDNLKNLRNYRDALPSYLQLSSNIGADGKKLKVPNTIVMMQHPFNNNRITTKPSARTKDAANNLGRGATIPIQYYDEFAFMPFNEEVLMAAAPAFSRASENAKAMGAPYGMLITSTPGDLLTGPGTYAYEVRNNATVWREEYYDLPYNQIMGLLAANNKSNMFFVRYDYKQLGEGQEYLNRMIKEMQSNWPKIRREVLLEWAESPTECPFSQDDLEIIKAHTRAPIRTIAFGKFGQYVFDVYKDVDLLYPPIIGVDVSGATFNDSSAITIIDSHTTEVCACMNCNFIPNDDLAEVIYELVTNYLPNGIINIEVNGGFGSSVVQRLVKTSVKKNLYWEVKDKVIEEAYNGTRMAPQKRKVKQYGLNSTKDVRARLIEILMQRVMFHKDKFISPILYDEMRAMEVKKSGKVEHSDKTHDDQVFSYLMALYVWYDGKNLVENFGLRKTTLKTDANEDYEIDEFEDAIEKKEKLDFNYIDKDLENPEQQQLMQDIEWVVSTRTITNEKLLEQQRQELINTRNKLMYTDPNLRSQLYAKTEQGVILDPVDTGMTMAHTQLPENLFMSYDVDDYDENGQPLVSANGTPLAGNLASFYDSL